MTRKKSNTTKELKENAENNGEQPAEIVTTEGQAASEPPNDEQNSSAPENEKEAEQAEQESPDSPEGPDNNEGLMSRFIQIDLAEPENTSPELSSEKRKQIKRMRKAEVAVVAAADAALLVHGFVCQEDAALAKLRDDLLKPIRQMLRCARDDVRKDAELVDA